MSWVHLLAQARQHLVVGRGCLPCLSTGSAGTSAVKNPSIPEYSQPIKHVSVIIGENSNFDHVFATYQPKRSRSRLDLLVKGIVNSDGLPAISL